MTTPVVEGGVYVIEQFSVKDAVGTLKPVQTKICIRFTKDTTVKEVADDGMIPLYKFEFLDLGDLQAEANKYQPRENPEFAIGTLLLQLNILYKFLSHSFYLSFKQTIYVFIF